LSFTIPEALGLANVNSYELGFFQPGFIKQEHFLRLVGFVVGHKKNE